MNIMYWILIKNYKRGENIILLVDLQLNFDRDVEIEGRFEG